MHPITVEPNREAIIQSFVDPTEIVKYYDQCEIDYKWVWHLSEVQAMHYGYWKSDTKRLRDALINMNELVGAHLDIEVDDTILDAGCGVGGTSFYLAKQHQIKTHGISLSDKQIARAKASADRMGLQHKVTFSVKDYTKTGFQNQSFDKVFGIESICHANEKLDFLAEAYRVLKPGGKLVVTDFFGVNMSNYTSHQSELMQKWADTWAVPAFEDIQDFVRKAQSVGFTVAVKSDITSNIMKSAKRLYTLFYPGIVAHYFLRLLSIRNKTQQKNVWSSYYQYKCFSRGLCKYYILQLTK